jgi:D-3-phosphoglycerate dehydrogenase
LLKAPHIVLTPHLGASTREAQLAVSIDAVQAMLDYLQRDVIRSAVNVAGLPSTLTNRDRAYLDLVKRMGGILAPLCAGGIERITVTTHGSSLAAITSTLAHQAVIELLSPHFSTRLNMVNAMDFAKQRGIAVEHTSSSTRDDFSDNVVIRVCARDSVQEIEGTVFVDGLPRVLAIGGYRMDMVPEGPMVLLFNDDQPGVIGLVGKTFGDQGVNIADMTLSRQNNRALMVFKCDEPVPEEAVQALADQCPPIRMVKTVELEAVQRRRPDAK